MLKQIRAHRFKGDSPHREGTIPIGSIIYIQDGVTPFGFTQPFVCQNPWIVESWGLRTWSRTFGTQDEGHLATVRSLRDGCRKQIADWILLSCIDADLSR